MKCRLIIFLILYLIPFGVYSQIGEQRVFLWDVTGSLLPKTVGKTVGGKQLPAFKNGNGMFNVVQKAVLTAIDGVEENPMSEIIVVPFQEEPLNVWRAKATSTGKAMLKQKVLDYGYTVHSKTYICKAMRKFVHELRDKSKPNYMFLFTDGNKWQGGDDFKEIICNWDGTSYGFYVIAHTDADIRDDIRRGNGVTEEDLKKRNFWFVKDANVKIKVCTLQPKVTHSVKSGSVLVLKVGGSTEEVTKNCVLNITSNDPYYNASLVDSSLSDGVISIKISPKVPVNTIPGNHTMILYLSQNGCDDYTFVTPGTMAVNVVNKPIRSVEIGFK